ncbi:DUF3604 domain-containing protein [Marimonas sp. MJW-29]|uniref:DUF3604 domain-containing protein n=1 Tax=Sulfitobacter sediminis TaxID=3234186 RepID=A0ABV3RU42_9RHOB
MKRDEKNQGYIGMMASQFLAGLLALLMSAHSVTAQDATPPGDKKVEYSPYPEKSFPNTVYFGDTHLHTSFSTDAGMVGNIRGPEEAYRLARGEAITSSSGLEVQLSRPLDFLVVSDHAENLGLAPAIAESNENLLLNAWGKAVHDRAKVSNDPIGAYEMWITQVNAKDDKLDGSGMSKVFWQRSNEISDKYNEPGLFTALIGYEWTSMPNGNNLHRNVVFRDGMDKTSQIVPMSSYDSDDPEDLWAWMAAYEKKTGGRALAIPHNGNLSNGLMFDDVTLISKKPIDNDYAQRRMRWEPVIEVTQIKGDSETHPALSPNDEFADFYSWDTGTFGANPTTPDMHPREYARAALKRGLVYEEKLGANPFKFGVIGSTDSHTAIASTEEDNFFGKVSMAEPSADPHYRLDEVIVGRFLADPSKQIRHFQTASGGLAAVWARENTREAIWDAIARKEVYATTGTRLRVRLFAGWDYVESDLTRSDFAEYAYQHGVPMGGDLTAAPGNKAPSLMVRALRDPDGANLDRVQVVKGWVEKNGEAFEKIYDIAVSDGREIGKDGRCKEPVGNTVNLEDVTYTNAIGDAFLQAYWKDPDFDPEQRAFYYVRVIEIPTPTWLAYDRKVFGSKIPEGGKQVHQERAYTTAVWYTP